MKAEDFINSQLGNSAEDFINSQIGETPLNKKDVLDSSVVPTFTQALTGQITPQPQSQADKAIFDLSKIDTSNKEGFLERVGGRLEKRQEEVTQTFEDYGKGEIGFPQAAVQVLGKAGAGGTLDILGEGVVSVGRNIGEVTPELIKEPVINAAKQSWEWIKESGAGQLAGQAISKGSNGWNEFKNEFPQGAKTIESVANIAILLAPTKVKINANPSVLGKAAKSVERSAERTTRRQRRDFIKKLVTPVESKKVLIDETSRTAEIGRGPFKRSVVNLSPQERVMAAEVKRVAGVSGSKTIQGNLNAIINANIKLAKKLDSEVKKSKILITRNEVAKNIDNAVDDLISRNPVIVGNAETTARRVATKAKEIIGNNPGTPKGVLDSRKQLDSWIRSQKGEKAFDPVMENALSIAVRTVRRSMNDTVSARVPGARIKSELKRQSILFDVIDNVAPKAAKESNTAIFRAWENTARVLPFRGEANQKLALLFGVGGLGAAAAFAPWITGATALVLGSVAIKKAVISPGARKGIASLISMTDKALLSSKNPSMIKQLRADRAILVELLKTSQEEK
ncbi:MAG: hypothetical protein BMS9Abin21_104 [Thermodesulfovibrionia bacterium]|nr:MAG: hypothetical protein BMS9Abin21_104 [Thermodesulfovibrionia bacterium]